MTHSHFIRKTLGIKDKNIHFEEQVTEERINDQNHLVLYGKLTYTPKACEKCGTVNHSSADIVKNGTKLSTLKLPPPSTGLRLSQFYQSENPNLDQL